MLHSGSCLTFLVRRMLLSLIPVEQLSEDAFWYHDLRPALLAWWLFGQDHGLVVLYQHVVFADAFVRGIQRADVSD